MNIKNRKKNCKTQIPIKNTTVIVNNRKVFECGKVVYKHLGVLKNKRLRYKCGLYYKTTNSKYYHAITQKKSKHFLKIGLMGVLIGFINGFFGGGGGMICVPVLTNIFKLKEKVAHATAIFIMLPLSISSLIVYFMHGTLNENSLGLIIIGFAGGAIIGALILNKINNVILKLIFSFIILAAGIRMLF